MSIGTFRFRTSFVCAVIAAAFSLTSQYVYAAGSGIIKGKILDKLTGDPLIGATVAVVGTSLGAPSNLNGEFIIHDVPVGEKTLKISYIGYLTITEQVVVPDGSVVEKDFRLQPQAVEGQAVIVTAQAKGQQEAINQQLSSDNIVNVVSSEKMKELPDANIAESIGRLPGVSLDRQNGEADKIIVRGMSPQFNKITIEGVPMVSMSGGQAGGYYSGGGNTTSDRSIDLSMLSDDLVKGVELSKSLRADMDADAIGGTVNFTLNEAPQEFKYDIQANGGYNDLTKYWKNYKVTGSVSDRFLNDAIGLRLQLSAEDKALPSQQFNAGYSIPTPQSSLNPLVVDGIIPSLIINTTSAQFTIDNLDRKRYGGSVILDYQSDFVDIVFFNLYNQKKDHDEQYSKSFNFQSIPSGLFSFLPKISDLKTEERTHSLQSKFKFLGTELDASFSYTKGNYSNPGQDFPFQQVNTINLSSPTLLVYAQPANLINLAGNDNINDIYLRGLDKTDNFLNDNSYDTKVDYHIPFRVSDYLSGKISLGGKYHKFDRVSKDTSVEYGIESAANSHALSIMTWLQQNVNSNASGYNIYGVAVPNFLASNYTPPTFLNGRYTMDPWGFNMGILKKLGDVWYATSSDSYYTDGPDSFNSDYSETEELAAGYIMAELNAGTDLTVVPGIRYEELKGEYGAYAVYTNNSNPNGLQGRVPLWRVFSETHINYFPSVNIKYKATENVQLVGAYYSSAARPDFSALSPLVDYPALGNINASGNPYLKPAIAQNFDLGVNVSSNNIGLFTVNGFYKEIKDLVYAMPYYEPARRADIVQAPADFLDRLPGPDFYDLSALNSVNSSTSVPINNPEPAFVRGIEFSWQTNFWYLPGMLSGLVLDVNAAIMSSRELYPYFDANSVIEDSVVHHGQATYTYYQAYRTRSGSLADMPKATYNIIVGWDYLGFSSRVSFRYQQTTLTSLDAKFSIADDYYDNVLLVDIMLKQKIVGNLSLFANLTNIGSHVDDYYYHAPININLPTSQQTYGFNAQFGISFYM
ncbi:MAG: TonB-dependent receptor [Bacteroidota bacterium]